MSTFERRLEALEARAAPSRDDLLLVIIRRGLGLRTDGEGRWPFARITFGNAEFLRGPGEDEAEFLRRLREVELPKLFPGERRMWCVNGYEAAA